MANQCACASNKTVEDTKTSTQCPCTTATTDACACKSCECEGCAQQKVDKKATDACQCDSAPCQAPADGAKAEGVTCPCPESTTDKCTC